MHCRVFNQERTGNLREGAAGSAGIQSEGGARGRRSGRWARDGAIMVVGGAGSRALSAAKRGWGAPPKPRKAAARLATNCGDGVARNSSVRSVP